MSEQQASSSQTILVEAPPKTIGGILRRLGPGLIVAGSIVGSGELIATTSVGAEAGFWLMWLILIGCVIKVFVQVEFGRYSIVTGNTTMTGLDEVPGPTVEITATGRSDRWALRGNWLVTYWLLMFLASLGQLGGIVGGVGQALQISIPLTSEGKQFNELVDAEAKYTVAVAELKLAEKLAAEGDQQQLERTVEIKQQVEELGPFIVEKRVAIAREQVKKSQNLGRSTSEEQSLTTVLQRIEEHGQRPEIVFADMPKGFGMIEVNDDKIWAAIIAVTTSVILVLGRYSLIQTFSTTIVGLFTLITIINLFALQMTGTWAVSWNDLVEGMRFQLPPDNEKGLATALAAFGIIGVGASELVSYPYWCQEKGYARFTGSRDDSPEWAERAKGWMRVMRWDAWCSMIVYTFATIAFYLLGAAILGRINLVPEGSQMIRTLSVMYEPVFGTWTQILFLFGAFAVLYSTFFVANASHARVFPDALRVFGFKAKTEQIHRGRVRFFNGLFPFMCLIVYVYFPQPVKLVLLSGLMQAIMLPMLAVAGLYFRYRRCDERIRPGMFWDVFLWFSAAGLLIAGGWAAWSKIGPMLGLG